LENGRGEDNEVPRRVWKAVETKLGETRMAEEKGRRKKKEKGEKREEKEKIKKKKLKGSKIVDVKKVAKEWEIWNEKEAAARSEEEKRS